MHRITEALQQTGQEMARVNVLVPVVDLVDALGQRFEYIAADSQSTDTGAFGAGTILAFVTFTRPGLYDIYARAKLSAAAALPRAIAFRVRDESGGNLFSIDQPLITMSDICEIPPLRIWVLENWSAAFEAVNAFLAGEQIQSSVVAIQRLGV